MNYKVKGLELPWRCKLLVSADHSSIRWSFLMMLTWVFSCSSKGSGGCCLHLHSLIAASAPQPMSSSAVQLHHMLIWEKNECWNFNLAKNACLSLTEELFLLRFWLMSSFYKKKDRCSKMFQMCSQEMLLSSSFFNCKSSFLPLDSTLFLRFAEWYLSSAPTN